MKTAYDSRNRPILVEDDMPINAVSAYEKFNLHLAYVSTDYGETNWGREAWKLFRVKDPAEVAKYLNRYYRYCDYKFEVREKDGEKLLALYSYDSMGD